MQKSNKKEFYKGIVLFSLLVFITIVLFSLPRLTIPLTISYIFCLIVKPSIPALVKLGLNKISSIILVMIFLIFIIVYPLIKFVPAITNEAQNFASYVPKIERYLQDEYKNIQVEVKKRTNYELKDSYVKDGITLAKKATTNFILSVPQIAASLLEWVFLIPLFVFFILRDGDSFKYQFLKLVPNSLFERFYNLSYQFNKKIGDYIFAKFVEASIVGIIITTGLLVLDVRFSFIFGTVAALTNVIPYLGPVLGAIPAIIFGLTEYGSGSVFVAIVILFTIANIIDLALVFPILVSKIVDIHPVTVVISVILGSQYLGVIGMVISIPMAAAVKLIFQEIYKEVYYGASR